MNYGFTLPNWFIVGTRQELEHNSLLTLLNESLLIDNGDKHFTIYLIDKTSGPIKKLNKVRTIIKDNLIFANLGEKINHCLPFTNKQIPLTLTISGLIADIESLLRFIPLNSLIKNSELQQVANYSYSGKLCDQQSYYLHLTPLYDSCYRIYLVSDRELSNWERLKFYGFKLYCIAREAWLRCYNFYFRCSI